VSLDPARVGRDTGRIAEASVMLEIEVRLPKGAGEQAIRTVTENS
jgi:hypothetical protein